MSSESKYTRNDERKEKVHRDAEAAIKQEASEQIDLHQIWAARNRFVRAYHETQSASLQVRTDYICSVLVSYMADCVDLTQSHVKRD